MMARVREEMKKKGHDISRPEELERFDYDLSSSAGPVACAARIAGGIRREGRGRRGISHGRHPAIRGCVPKKLYVHASASATSSRTPPVSGWTVAPARFDWPTLVAAMKRRLRVSPASTRPIWKRRASSRSGARCPDRAERHCAVERTQRHGPIISGDRRLACRGAGSWRDLAISSNEIFDLPKFPDRLMVVGGGYIAVGMPSARAPRIAGFTQVFRADNVLRGFDGEIAKPSFRRRDAYGRGAEAWRAADAYERAGEAFRGRRCPAARQSEVDQVPDRNRRLPHTRGLGLEQAGEAEGRRRR